MALRTTQIATKSGITPTSFTPNASDTFEPGSILRVVNNNAGTCTVTMVTPASIDGNAIADVTISIPTGQTRYIDIPTNDIYKDANGKVECQFSVTSSVACEVVARQ